MELVIHIADTTVKMIFIGQAKRTVPLCREYFRGFLHPAEIVDAEIRVSILKNANGFLPTGEKGEDSSFEQKLISKEVFAWLSRSSDYQGDFPETETTIASSCLDGLLLFDPDTAAGRIYLLNEGMECFRPLHRLLSLRFLSSILDTVVVCVVREPICRLANVLKDNNLLLFSLF